ncbi:MULTISPECIES: hypothetical protein [unclassified Nocardioides]|uniref:hypothetical protein n=1 Tax=unclassified Nocardioides TaxID=2615069 RepID=UPI0006F7FC80|nr:MULTISPECIES: hypothetical protein [unclassified Nocardioides]KRA31370.1 hypothetical protein ASD81_18195 [Nocardioides sp. Root614]KRA87991.1 hypothetical protein ASD84_18470 [Nocardioides sp. Root682]
MRRHTAESVIMTALGQLDPAPKTQLTEEERGRADAAFARIVATAGDQSVPVEPTRPHRRRNRLLVTAGLAAAAGVAVPVLLLGGGTAYGSWTPTPTPLTGAAADAAATACRAALAAPGRGERVALAERRGEWTYVLLAGPRGEAACVMPDELVAHPTEREKRKGFLGSYTPDPSTPPSLDPSGFEETASMGGSTEEGWVNWTAGYVGSEVSGVTVHTSDGLDIEASVAGNRFAVWWPSVPQSSEHPEETWSYTVHLADGSTRPAS